MKGYYKEFMKRIFSVTIILITISTLIGCETKKQISMEEYLSTISSWECSSGVCTSNLDPVEYDSKLGDTNMSHMLELTLVYRSKGDYFDFSYYDKSVGFSSYINATLNSMESINFDFYYQENNIIASYSNTIVIIGDSATANYANISMNQVRGEFTCDIGSSKNNYCAKAKNLIELNLDLFNQIIKTFNEENL